MKKFSALISVTLFLVILVLTGCASNSNTTAKPSPVKNTISPTATADIELIEDTIYDEETFTITIPKEFEFVLEDKQYIWKTKTDEYWFNIVISQPVEGIKTSSIISSSKNLESFLKFFEDEMDRGYKETTLGGKRAILLTGSGKNSDGEDYKLQYYCIDTEKGMLFVTVYISLYDNDTQTSVDADNDIKDIFSTLTIK